MTLEAMRVLRLVLTIVLVATLIADAGQRLTARAATQPAAADLTLLQGTWEGVAVGDRSFQKITITITGSSLHFHRDTNFWFETTITLPGGTNPKQLRATIKGCPPSQASSIGQVVGAIFKIDDGTLTLAATADGDEETASFEDRGLTRYELRKVRPKTKTP